MLLFFFSSLLCPLPHAAINATAAQMNAHTYVTDCETVTHTAGLGVERCSLLALKGLSVCCLSGFIRSWQKFDFTFQSKSVLSFEFEF